MIERAAGPFCLAHAPVDDYRHETLARFEDLLRAAEAVDHDALGAAQGVGQDVIRGLGDSPERGGHAEAAGRVSAGRADGHEPVKALAGGVRHLLIALHHGRVRIRQDAEQHGGGFHHVGEGSRVAQGREGGAETRQQAAPEVDLGVGDEGVVLVLFHVLRLDVLPGSLVGESAAGPLDEVQAELLEHPGGSDRRGLEVGTEVLVVFDDRLRALLIVVHGLFLGESAVLAHVESAAGRDRHPCRLLQGEGVDKELATILIILLDRVAHELDAVSALPTLEPALLSRPSIQFVPALEHRVSTFTSHVDSFPRHRSFRQRQVRYQASGRYSHTLHSNTCGDQQSPSRY